MSMNEKSTEYSLVEYIWLDGARHVKKLRSKTRVLSRLKNPTLSDLPVWSFDGSSTYQATGGSSDCELKPVYLTKDPTRGEDHYLALCEVYWQSETHSTNTRSHLVEMMEKGGNDLDIYIGFEQEYTLMYDGYPLGWPQGGFPGPQGPFYCGVGSGKVFGREIVEKHLLFCAQIGLAIYGVNAEVMPGQWEFQIGYRNRDYEKADPLTISDQTVLARYLLYKIAEDYTVKVSFANKPIKGDWNGAGLHTNFSTRDMRDLKTGKETVAKVISQLEKNHSKHIDDYGHKLNERLTGLHETCAIDSFKSGVSDRGASVRIPLSTGENGYGYLEDRRPGANSDPYMVSTRIVETLYQAHR